ncbi:hypothetical protein D0T53_13280 [Dysgonomonas sp. 216]|uniref:hypothetical protein n=1 Tax=Dysgonomonas sp. 216 TaxID=2302934 RepID=UPI0013CFF2AB|nr:hypothetical protein [Dysgonomonas sp. 216]NDW19871.1 hypothetical protein [Dysgonomonas sp. 216]
MASNVLINFSADTGGLDEANRKLQELKTQEQELTREVQNLQRVQAADAKAAKNEKERAKAVLEYEKAIVDTKKSIEDLSNAQKELEKNIASSNIEKSFRAIRFELEEQLRVMRLNGEAGSEEYEKIRQKLTELNIAQKEVTAELKQQTSATYVFDSILQGTQLATGGVSVLTGAYALLGQENKEIQQLMLKLNALTTINTGLQQVQNAVMGEGNIIQRVSILQTRAKVAAEALSTKGTITATIAQKAFNLVAYANPYVLLAVAIITVVGALYIFSRNTETAAEKQKKLNELVKESIDLKDKYADELKKRGEENIASLQREYDLMKARGASEAQLALKQRQIDQERIKNANTMAIYYKDEISNIEKNKAAVDKYTRGLANMNNALYEAQKKGLKKTTFMFDGQVQKISINEKAIESAREKLQQGLDISTLRLNQGRSALKQQEEAIQEEQKNREEANKKAAEAGRRSAIAEAEYRVLISKKGSQEELNAQISALEAKKQADLQNANITKGERLRITKETELQIQQLRDDYNKKQLQDELELINAGLSAAKEGSIQEYNLNINRLAQQKKIELSDRNLTANQKLAIEAKYNKEVEKLTDDYLNHVAETETNTQLSTIKTRLAQAKSGTEEEYSLRILLAEENARLQRQDVENTIKNEELKAARIKEINAELAKEKKEILNDQDTSTIKRNADQETLIYTQQYEKGKISRREYESEMNRITIESLNKQIDARRKNGEDTIDLEQELAEKRIEIAEQEAEARAAIQEELFNTISVLSSTYYDSQKNKIQQQLSDLDHYYTTDAEKAKENSNLKLISEEEYNRRQLELKQKQAKAEKNEAIFNLILTNGQAVARAFKDYPFPASAVIAALVGVQTLAQLNNIRSQPLPKYWKGRKGGKGEFALVGEYGAELMYIPKGASIMPSYDSAKALNGDYSVMNKWNMPAMNPSYPVVPAISQQLITDARSSYDSEIDYDKIGKSVAKYQKKPVERPVYVSVDRSGTTITDGNTKTKYLNNKFKGVM